jgi:hypothetical protein
MEEHIARARAQRFGEHLWLDITLLVKSTSSTTCTKSSRFATTSWA